MQTDFANLTFLFLCTHTGRTEPIRFLGPNRESMEYSKSEIRIFEKIQIHQTVKIHQHKEIMK